MADTDKELEVIESQDGSAVVEMPDNMLIEEENE